LCLSYLRVTSFKCGHGKQYLVRNPAQNNGIAVVRREDNRSGYEGYTGDIMGNGGNNHGGNWSGGWWNDSWNGGGWGFPRAPVLAGTTTSFRTARTRFAISAATDQ
jgi:hypothetical protein